MVRSLPYCKCQVCFHTGTSGVPAPPAVCSLSADLRTDNHLTDDLTLLTQIIPVFFHLELMSMNNKIHNYNEDKFRF